MKHIGTKRIETERLLLRPFEMEDAEPMFNNWASDSEVTKYLMWPTHENLDDTKKVLQNWISEYEKKDKYIWCVELKETGEAIGSFGVGNLNEKARIVEMAYCIGRSYWHQGITSEALKAIMKFFFEEVGVNRIEARHDPKNPHSGSVMKKCGMKYEGTKVQGDWNNSGICDMCFYGLVKEQEREEEDEEPSNVISDATIEYVGILAKLELSEDEKEQAKKDMGKMLRYIDKLNELDTTGVEPLSHVFPVHSVFREDVVENGDDSVSILENAPEKKDRSFKVPKTIE